MAIAISNAVFQEVQQKVADHQAGVNLIQNQLAAANASLADWTSILSDLLNADATPIVEPAPAPVDGIG